MDDTDTPMETPNDIFSAEIDTGDMNAMMDYVERDSTSPCSDADPFDILSESDDSAGKPRRKKFTLASHVIIKDSTPVCYFCTACESYFSHRRTARYHEFCGTGMKPFKCKLCDKRFVKRSDRDNHHKAHTGEKPYVCSVCDKSFHLKHKLSRHIRSHTGVKGDFLCTECDRTFISRVALRKHQVSKHNPNKSIQCKNCGKSFDKTEERQKHKCSRPPKKKKLVCEKCGKTFSKNWNLTVHLRIHVGQRPFRCSVCSKSFRLRQHLERHSTKHQADADFECMLCKQTFRRKDNMIRHLKLNHPDRHLGIDIKNIVQRSEKAKLGKSKKSSKEPAAGESKARIEKTPTVLSVDNLPNIRFAKMSSVDVGLVESPRANETNSSIPVEALPGPSAQKLFERRIERSVVLETVIKSGSTVRRSVETRRFVQSTVVERIDPFKSRGCFPARSITESQPSVLVFNKAVAPSGDGRRVEECFQICPPTEPGVSAPSVQPSQNSQSPRCHQVSVLRFNSSGSVEPSLR